MGMRRDNIEFIIRELSWLKNRGQEHSICDILVGFYHHYAIPVEVKHSDAGNQYIKAKRQVLQGRKFIEHRFHLPVPYGLLMVYNDNGVFLPPQKLFVDERVEERIPLTADFYSGNLI